jgi:23S rRNA pseudouridine955/2504/2580 synthase
MRTIKVESSEAGITFEQFVVKCLPLVPKVLYYQYLRKKCFKLNGIHLFDGKEILKENDILSFYVDDHFFEKGVKSDPRIEIVYEDDKMIVANKPEGILSHADDQLKKEDDLLTILSHQKNVATGTYSLVNRLDFNTSGLIIVGKTPAATKELNDAAQRNQIQKYYRCLAYGYFDKPTDELRAYLLKDEPSSLVRISPTFLPRSQEIITRYTVLQEGNAVSFLEIELLTGKTHQIRAHLAAIDHPILGDPLYGNVLLNKKFALTRQALWASKLVFSILDPSSPLCYLNGKILVKDEPQWLRFLQKKS